MIRLIHTMVLVLSFVAAVRAQEPDTIKVGTDLVSVNVTVTGPGGRYVAGLTKDQFEVMDDNVRQRIAFFSASDAPMSFGIIYDLHPTTGERTAATLRALRQFVRTLRADDDYFTLTFNEYGSLVLDFVPTAEQVQVNPIPGAAGPSSLYDAVYLAGGKIRQSRNSKRALLVISDGEDHHSQNNYRQLRERLSTFDVQIYAVNLPDPRTNYPDQWLFEDLSRGRGHRRLLEDTDAALGRAVLDELSRVTGGTAYFPEARSDRELVGICTQIAFEMRRQYAIGFYPTDSTERNRQHKLKIGIQPQSAGSDLVISYRKTYRLEAEP